MDEDARIGQLLLGKLRVIRRLGRGGMGTVYEVEHQLTGHRRALKLVHAKHARHPRFMKRLLREAKVAGTLGTPYVVETFDAGRLEDGAGYVLMELLEGRSLYDVLQDRGPMKATRLVRLLLQIAEGMQVAHEAGIIHRDLKPENVFLLRGPDERVKILDFGVSRFPSDFERSAQRLTAEGTLVGTPHYMSPEQAAGQEIDARADVYALGVMAYEALTGRLPFEGDTVAELLLQIGAGRYVPLQTRRPGLDPGLAEVLEWAMAPERDDRPESMEELRRALAPYAGGGAMVEALAGEGVVISRDTLGPGGASVDVASRDLASTDDDEVRRAPPPSGRSAAIPPWAWAVGAGLLVAFAPFALGRFRPPEPAPPPVTAASPEPPSRDEAATLEAATLEAATLEAATLEAATLEAATLEATSIEAAPAAPAAPVEPDPDSPSSTAAEPPAPAPRARRPRRPRLAPNPYR